MRGCKSEGVCFSLSGFCWVELTVKWRVDGVCVCVCTCYEDQFEF